MTAPTVTYERGILNGTTEEPKQGVYEESATQQYELGTRMAMPDGRAYRYAQAGAVALVAGNLLQSAVLSGATTTAQTDLAIATSAVVGDEFAYATIATTAQSADAFRDGWYVVTQTTAANGRGTFYPIASHGALTVASNKIPLKEKIRVATVAGTSLARLVANPYKKVIQAPVTTVTGMVVGVAPMAVTASYFCWIQTWGPANVLVKTAVTIGTAVVRDVILAGAVASFDGALINEAVGYALTEVPTTDDGMIFLQIAP